MNNRRGWKIGIIFFVFLFLAGMFLFRGEERDFNYSQDILRSVWVEEDGLVLPYTFVGRKTVADFLKENNLMREGRSDEVSFLQDKLLFGGETLIITRTKKVFLSVGDEEKRELETTRRFASDLIIDVGIPIASDDFILPSPYAPLEENQIIEVVRVMITEELEKKDIAFETRLREDADLGWRIRKITVKGEKGVLEKKYKVISHNGKMVKKTLVSEETVREPVIEEVVQGTYVKVGKKHTGQGTWYAHTGTLAAASPWLPLGSYARVTNKENGKSVIVKINDRGPFGKNRIIDLDKVAFAKIAPIGSGVIDVMVEEVLN